MVTLLSKFITEKEALFEQQYRYAKDALARCAERDAYWGDNNATLVAAINIARAAQLAIDVIALKKMR